MGEDLNRAFTETIASKGFQGIIFDSMGISIEKILENELLNKVSVIKWYISYCKIGAGINERFNIKKILTFFNQLNDVSDSEKQNFLNYIENEKEYRDDIFEKILIILEKLDEVEKAQIIGNLFKARMRGKIDLDEFFQLSSVVQRSYFKELKSFILYGSNLFDEETRLRYIKYHTKEAQKNLASLGLLNENIREDAYRKKNTPGGSPIEYKFEYDYSSIGRTLRDCAY